MRNQQQINIAVFATPQATADAVADAIVSMMRESGYTLTHRSTWDTPTQTTVIFVPIRPQQGGRGL